MASLRVTINAKIHTAAGLKKAFQVPAATMTRYSVLNRLSQFVESQVGGTNPGSTAIQVVDNEVTATGTLTTTSAVATNTFTINGVTFTGIASGATGNQFNIGGSDTLTAANIASAINASVTALVASVVTATSASNVVTISAAQPGLLGNAITIASGQGTIVASGARLTGGAADASSITYSF